MIERSGRRTGPASQVILAFALLAQTLALAPGAAPARAADQVLSSSADSRWSSMTEEQREEVRRNFKAWKAKPPEQKRELSERFKRFQSLPPFRRRMMMRLQRW